MPFIDRKVDFISLNKPYANPVNVICIFKNILYQYIERTLQPGAQVDLLELEVEVSVLSGDGKTLQIWEYDDCSIADYVVFLNFEKEEFRWSDEDGSEIRELFFFSCRGIDFSAASP